MTIALKIIMLLITVVAFMGMIAEPGKENKIMFTAITIAGIIGTISAFVLL